MKRLRLTFWRFRLKARYLEYRGILDEFSCGSALAEHVSSRLSKAKASVNKAIRKCRKLDPACQIEEF